MLLHSPSVNTTPSMTSNGASPAFLPTLCNSLSTNSLTSGSWTSCSCGLGWILMFEARAESNLGSGMTIAIGFERVGEA